MGTESKSKKKSKKSKEPAVELSADIQPAEAFPTNEPEDVAVENAGEVQEALPIAEPPTVDINVAVDKKVKKTKAKKEKTKKKNGSQPNEPTLSAEVHMDQMSPSLPDPTQITDFVAPVDETAADTDAETASKRSGSKRKKSKDTVGRASRGLSGLFIKKGGHETGESGAETDVVDEQPAKQEKRKSKTKPDRPEVPPPALAPAPVVIESNGFDQPMQHSFENGGSVAPPEAVTKRKKKSKRFKNNEQQRTSHVFKDGDLMRPSVRLLDDELHEFVVHRKSTGRELFETVCDYLNLAERDYFGLRYLHDTGVYFWLDTEKEIRKQMEDAHLKYSWEFDFCVKFYPPEPSLLQEELTRYLLCLQVRRDLVSPHGELRNCSFVTQALLGSYVAQSELGDYEPELESSVRAMRFSARQDPRATEYQANAEENHQIIIELFDRIIELYKTHTGIRPDEADYRFLENAKRLEFYGIEFVDALDASGTPIRVGVYYSGVVVYQGRVRISRFAWPKVLKLSYHGPEFKLRVRPEIDIRNRNNLLQEIVIFRLQDARVAKRLWKSSVEQHTFYRKKGDEIRKKASGVARLGTLVNTIGSSRFHYSGRTLYQYRTGPARQDPPPAVYRTLQKGQARSMPALERGSISQNGAVVASSRDVRTIRAVTNPADLESVTLPRTGKHRAVEPPNNNVGTVAPPSRPPPPAQKFAVQHTDPTDFENNVNELDVLLNSQQTMPTYYMPPDDTSAIRGREPPPPLPTGQPPHDMVTLYDDTDHNADLPVVPPRPYGRPPAIPPKTNVTLNAGTMQFSIST